MPEIKPKETWKVVIIESESGWGQKVNDVKYFDNEDEANSFVETFNSANNQSSTPSWYMFANSPQRIM